LTPGGTEDRARVFGDDYASIYDALYAEKQYDAECDFLEQVFGRYARTPVRRIVDLGCGTGGHAIRLAARGYEVTGVDRAPAMVAHAREKSAASLRSPHWVVGDIRDIDLGARFDAAIMMFAVASYLVGDDDLARAFAAIRRHLDAGALLVFDVWYGPAVLADAPRPTERTVRADGEVVRRVGTPDVDVARALCTMRYAIERAGASIQEEEHVVRFFFGPELERLLDRAGFALVAACRFGNLDASPDATSHDATFVAVAR
jgi:SAM-dependent methyltransferase